MLPATRITDVLSQVERWTGFTQHFGHVSTGLPPGDEQAFLATLIAEATNLGLSRMAEVCGAGSRRALLRMQTWHMREETFRAALACLTDAIHRSEEHTSELQSLMRIPYAVFCLKKKNTINKNKSQNM